MPRSSIQPGSRPARRGAFTPCKAWAQPSLSKSGAWFLPMTLVHLMRATRKPTAAVRTAELGLDLSALTAARRNPEQVEEAVRSALRGGVRLLDSPDAEIFPFGAPGLRLMLHAGKPLPEGAERLAPGEDVTLVLSGAAVLADRPLWKRAQALRDGGACDRVGLAVEPGGDALGLAKRFKPTVMQIACGLLDQRAVRSGALETIASMGIEIQLRTSLLRGLLFLPREALPAALSEAGSQVSRARRMIAESGADPLQAALAFALHRPEASAVVVPAGSVGEVRALLAASAAPLPDLDWPALALDHPAALDAEAELYRRAAA